MAESRSEKPGQQGAENFFLPDLCTAQSSLVLFILALLLALVVSSLQQGLWPIVWADFSLVSLFCLLVFLSSASVLCLLRGILARLSLAIAASLSYLLVLLVVSVYSLAGQWLLSTTGADPLFSPQRLLQHLFIGAVVAGIGLRYLYLSWQLRQREQSEMQARIQALQSRIQPHFLFNSLNTIASLIDDCPADAERAVEDLAALFRANLQDNRVFSDWRAERELCERYLSIEKMRLGERLQIRWQDEAMNDDAAVLSLSLQPLLENAVVHGIQQLPEGGCILVSARCENNDCCIVVTNPIPESGGARAGNQLACDNLRHRLHSIYGERGQLRMSEKDGKFQVDLRFPLTIEQRP